MLPAVCTCSPRALRRSLAGGECGRGMNDATSNCNFYCGYCVSSRSRLGSAAGKSASLGLVAETTNPSFLAIDRTRRFLYAVNEISDYQGQKSGSVSAFAIDRKTAKLAFLNEVPSRGADPCYVTLDKSGKYVLVANYGGGNVAAFPILNDGR